MHDVDMRELVPAVLQAIDEEMAESFLGVQNQTGAVIDVVRHLKLVSQIMLEAQARPSVNNQASCVNAPAAACRIQTTWLSPPVASNALRPSVKKTCARVMWC